MKILVIQEQHFVRMPNGEVWVDAQSDRRFWDRYLSVFEEVVVCARFIHAKDYNTDNLIRSDKDRVSFIELPNSRGVASLIKNIVSVTNIMRKAIRDCDCVIFRAPSPISMVAYPIAKMSGKPYAAEIMNNPYTHFSPDSMHHFYQPLLRWFIVEQTKSLCRNANGVSYVTENVLQNLYPSHAKMHGETRKYFEGSYSTIRMDADMYYFEEWPIVRPKRITLVHTGKMQDNRKGQDVFIEAIALLRKRGYDVDGILIGEGEMRAQFEKIGEDFGIAQYLDFVGWKAGFEAVKKELNRAQFGVFPSTGEGLPRSVIEGMAQGLLCFGSDIDGICELLEGECLVPEFTGVCFADHIEHYLKNWNLALEERKKQFMCSKKYESSILMKKRIEFYTKLKNAVE